MSPSRRLKYRDYSAPGLYFVTVCSDFKNCTFGRVVDKEVVLSPLGRIVDEAWHALPSRTCGIRLHEHVVMPNHIHGIIEIVQHALAQQAPPLQGNAGYGSVSARTPSLSIIVRSFKADVTRRAGVELDWKKEIWQHNYFDRVIRDGREFENASRYIMENASRWQIQGQRLKVVYEAR